MAHRHTTGLRTTTQVTADAGFAQSTVLVIGVADLADRCAAIEVDPARLARGQHDRCVVAFLIG